MMYWTEGAVSLRRCDADDWQLLYAQLQDSEDYFWFDDSVQPPCTEAAAAERWEAVLAMHAEEGRMDLAICVEEETVGMVSLSMRDEANGVFTAPVFVLREYQGRGYAKTALQLLLRYAFDERRLHKLQASVLAENERSVALHKAIGCEVEGCFKAQVYHEGRWHDEFWFGLTEEQWRA